MKTPMESIQKGVEVGGMMLQSPLNAKRMRVLIRRKNPLFSDEETDDPLVGAESVFYCLTRTSDELAAMFSETQMQWDERVGVFAESLEDGALEDFAALLGVEEDAIGDATVQPIDAGKMEAPQEVTETAGRNLIGSTPSQSLECLPACPTPRPMPSLSSKSSESAMPKVATTAENIEAAETINAGSGI